MKFVVNVKFFFIRNVVCNCIAKLALARAPHNHKIPTLSSVEIHARGSGQEFSSTAYGPLETI